MIGLKCDRPPGLSVRRRRRLARGTAFALLFASVAAAANPFLPLSSAEIRQAVNIVRASGRAPAGSQFSLVALKEPPKDLVLKQVAVPRRAFVVLYNYPNNQTFEGVVNLGGNAVESWKLVPGAEAAVSGEALFLLVFWRYLGISRRHPSFGIAMAFGAYAGMDLAVLGFRVGGITPSRSASRLAASSMMPAPLPGLPW